MQEKEIIAPIPKEVVAAELTKDKFVRYTNYGKNHIYILDYHDSPNVMLEIGRLREVAFRGAGGGTGKDVDIDQYDTHANPYKQLIVWDPNIQEILGGYRYFDCKNLNYDKDGKIDLATSSLFNMTKEFELEYLPYTIELGRSFVQPRFQASKMDRQAVFALDNLWDGLGALWERSPHLKYFFGKVTMYTHFNIKARDMILYFLKIYFNDEKKLFRPYYPVELQTNEEELKALFVGGSFREDYKILSANVRELGENIPPLFNSYMNLSPTFKVFGTAINHHFGGVEETGIQVTMADIYESKKKRHLTM